MLKKLAAVVGMVVGMGACGVAEAQTVYTTAGVFDVQHDHPEIGVMAEFGDKVRGYTGISLIFTERTHTHLYSLGVRGGETHFIDTGLKFHTLEHVEYNIGYGYRKGRFLFTVGTFMRRDFDDGHPPVYATVGYQVF